MARNEVKYGALLSYVLIFANTIYGFIVMPYVLSQLGNSEYGVYKTIGSMVATVSVLEMGIGATMQRYIAKFNTQKNRQAAENFSAMGFLQAVVLALIALCVGLVLYTTLEHSFPKFTAEEMHRAKQIFLMMLLQIALHMFENFFFGVISGYNRFTFSNTLKLCSLAFRIALYYIVLPIFPNALTIVGITVSLEALLILISAGYLRLSVGHRIHLQKWDRPLFKESLVYTLLLFCQSMIIQFNGNVDSWVIGAVMGTSFVTIYSFALQLFNMYEQCATSISGVLLPTVTKRLTDGANAEDMEDLVVKYGRLQWMFLGAALFGFITCGKEFFHLWLNKSLGDKTAECWYLSLILMVPVTFPLITNTCLTILKAKNLMRFRTISLAYSVVINIILTYVGTKYYGYWAAAAGTAASTVIGSIISMNIYYHKKLGLNMLRIYRHIFAGTTPCLIAASLIALLLNRILFGSWLELVLKAIVFLAVYAVCMLVYGLRPQELAQFVRKKGNKS